MPQLYYDVLFGLIFVFILLVMSRIRRTAFARDGAAYRRIIIGLFIFAGLSGLQIAGHQSAFEGWFYLGDAAGRETVEAIGIIAGLILVLSGIGAWLPSLTMGRENQRKLNKRYYCLKMINENLDRSRNLDDAYARATSCLSSYLGFRRCAVYKYSSRHDTLHLSGSAGFDGKSQTTPDRISLSGTPLKNVLTRFRAATATTTLPEWNGSQGPDIIIPIAFKTRLYGVYFCWLGQVERIDDDLLDFTSTLGQMIGRYTHTHVVEVRRSYHRHQQSAYERLSEICNQVATVKDLVPRLFNVIGDMVGAEYLSLASLDNSGENMIRYTIGSGGRLLLEKGVSRPTRGTDIYTAFESGRSIVHPDIRPDDRSGEQDGLFLSCGMRSRISCPIRAGNRIVGVLTLGHTSPGHFGRYLVHRIENLADVIAGVVQRQHLYRSLEIKEDHMLRLELMQRQMLDNPPAQSFFEDACELLTNRMKCTIARISLLDRDRTRLISQACRSIRETGNELRADESIPLSLLPWHRMALDARKPMMINQDDPESRMPPQESTSSLIPNIKSALLVPIMLNDHVRGIISVGEARNWNRRSFGATDLIFARDVAAKCSLALRMKRLELNAERNREEIGRMMNSDGEDLTEIRTRIKSPLTSIIGAVDLLRMKGAGEESSGRYYEMILKSADRIRKLTEWESAVDPEKEIGSESVIG